MVHFSEPHGQPLLEVSDETDLGIFSLGDEDNPGFRYQGNSYRWTHPCVPLHLYGGIVCRPSINEWSTHSITLLLIYIRYCANSIDVLGPPGSSST